MKPNSLDMVPDESAKAHGPNSSQQSTQTRHREHRRQNESTE